MPSLFNDLSDWQYFLTNPVALALTAFQIWMFVHAVRSGEYIWAAFIFIGWGLSAILYYFLVYRAVPSSTRGFELPGAHDRKRIKELQAQIHHLDKAHHHSHLGDIYFQQGKLDLAASSYRAALERDPSDLDTRAHLGQCLLRQKLPAEARPLLEGVIAENPRHEYGYTRMALAETLTALGETDAALKTWLQVTAAHSYPRAKVQLAELYLARNETAPARAQLDEVIADDLHTLPFQRKRDRVWVRRAKSLLRKIPRPGPQKTIIMPMW
jgi:tetratricopeptide (TPR) repeat protein